MIHSTTVLVPDTQKIINSTNRCTQLIIHNAIQYTEQRTSSQCCTMNIIAMQYSTQNNEHHHNAVHRASYSDLTVNITPRNHSQVNIHKNNVQNDTRINKERHLLYNDTRNQTKNIIHTDTRINKECHLQ